MKGRVLTTARRVWPDLETALLTEPFLRCAPAVQGHTTLRLATVLLFFIFCCKTYPHPHYFLVIYLIGCLFPLAFAFHELYTYPLEKCSVHSRQQYIFIEWVNEMSPSLLSLSALYYRCCTGMGARGVNSTGHGRVWPQTHAGTAGGHSGGQVREE